jgi:hypothetical protein
MPSEHQVSDDQFMEFPVHVVKTLGQGFCQLIAGYAPAVCALLLNTNVELSNMSIVFEFFKTKLDFRYFSVISTPF